MLVIRLKAGDAASKVTSEQRAAADFRRLAAEHGGDPAVPMLLAMADAMDAAAEAKRARPRVRDRVCTN